MSGYNKVIFAGRNSKERSTMPYTLNGQPGNIAEEPNEQQGVVYVPYKQVVEGLGGTVTWDNTSKTAVGLRKQKSSSNSASSQTTVASG